METNGEIIDMITYKNEVLDENYVVFTIYSEGKEFLKTNNHDFIEDMLDCGVINVMDEKDDSFEIDEIAFHRNVLNIEKGNFMRIDYDVIWLYLNANIKIDYEFLEQERSYQEAVYKHAIMESNFSIGKNIIIDECFNKIIDIGFTKSEIQVFKLLCYIFNYNNESKNLEDKKLLRRKDISEYIGVSNTTVCNAIDKLKKNELIMEAITVEGNVFLINPFILKKEYKQDDTMLDLFEKTKWARW